MDNGALMCGPISDPGTFRAGERAIADEVESVVTAWDDYHAAYHLQDGRRVWPRFLTHPEGDPWLEARGIKDAAVKAKSQRGLAGFIPTEILIAELRARGVEVTA